MTRAGEEKGKQKGEVLRGPVKSAFYRADVIYAIPLANDRPKIQITISEIKPRERGSEAGGMWAPDQSWGSEHPIGLARFHYLPRKSQVEEGSETKGDSRRSAAKEKYSGREP